MVEGTLRLVLAASVASAMAACSASGDGRMFGGGGVGGGDGTASGAGGIATGTGAGGELLVDAGGVGDASTVGAGCSEASQFVYTLTADHSLYRFDPPTLAFQLVGVLDCATASTPYSMAVDRAGHAWSVFSDGTLHQIDTTNAHCTPTSFAVGQHGFTTFGMGFSTDAPGSDQETLFVSEANFTDTTRALGRIDLATMTLTPVGSYDAVDARAELTGTGDARLFGAFEGSPYVVAQIDKATAKIVSQAPQSAINYAPGSSNFAFAFWGGDFWLFVGPGTYTDVFRYKPSDGTTTKVTSVSYEIVGAGVSTCAPTTPPS